MKITSIIAIYFLLWVLSAFLVMPFGLRTHDDEAAETVPGQVTSAPVNFDPRRIALRATILAALLCGFYYFNYVYGWITADDIDLSWIWN
ncbi:MAG TPA: DUF1467 family protein [Novosphingobium sp.]|nr:DUF1467 family protein [Novosphingobium sp.]